MLKQKITGLSAATLRLLLSLGILLLIAIGVGLFWLAFSQLKQSAAEVQSINAEASSSGDNLNALRSMETKLASSAESIQRAKDIVAESKSYEYQDTIMNDIETYAGRSGLGIASYSFSSADSATAGGSAAPAAPSTAAPAEGAAAPSSTGLKSTTVSVSLAGGSKFENLMTFINFLEQNLTKMQLSGVSLSRDEQTNSITSGELTIEVYIR